jgi:hypothetical protein
VLWYVLFAVTTGRWDALQRLLCRLLTRLYDAAEEQGDSIDDMESLSVLLAQSGGMPPALLAALEAALAAQDLDGEYQVCFRHISSDVYRTYTCSGWMQSI